jgi:hypothetical protein
MMQTLENTFPTIADIARPAPRPAALQNYLLDKALAASCVPLPSVVPVKPGDWFADYGVGCAAVFSKDSPDGYDLRYMMRGGLCEVVSCACPQFGYKRTCRHAREFTFLTDFPAFGLRAVRAMFPTADLFHHELDGTCEDCETPILIARMYGSFPSEVYYPGEMLTGYRNVRFCGCRCEVVPR